MLDQEMAADMTRTPFVQQKSGHWALFLITDKTLVWGHRFDVGVGYRVFLKFQDSLMANIFFPQQAINRARQMRAKNTKPTDQELAIADKLEEMAAQVGRLNDLWAAAGAPDEPLDKIGEAGNA